MKGKITAEYLKPELCSLVKYLLCHKNKPFSKNKNLMANKGN